MRIAYLTGEYPRVTDTFIQREVAELRRLGATVQPFSVRRPRHEQALSPAQKEERDRTSYLLPAHPFRLLNAQIKLLRRPSRYFSALALAWKTRQLGIRGTLYQGVYFLEAGLLVDLLHQQNIAHLHNHIGDSSGTVTMLASALGDFGYSFTLHGPGIFFEPMRWHLDEKISRAKFVCCISQFCRSQAMIFAPIAAWPKLQIIHCGVNPQSFDQPLEASAAPRSGQVSNSINCLSTALNSGQRLLYVGRLAAAKGLPILLKSLAMLVSAHPTVHLTVVGEGPDRELLERQVAALDMAAHVDFVGSQPPDQVRRYLQAADVFVMSSFAEGVPVVLMEAMMAQRPVVATQIAGVSELVEDGVSGFLVPPSDVERLRDRIHQLLSDKSLRQQLGQQGQRRVRESFNIHHEAKKLYALMVAAIAEQPAAERTIDLATAPVKSSVGVRN